MNRSSEQSRESLRTALYVITKHGLTTAKRLVKHQPSIDVFVSKKFCHEFEGAKPLALPFKGQLAEQFGQYDTHLFIISVGAVVRMIAPLIVDKKTDPAVLCIDDKAQWVIPILSGHVGRANEFTRRIADALDAQAVITTASDVQNTIPVDILGRELSWQLADANHNVTRNSAAVVNEQSVLFIQDCGEPDFWPTNRRLPKNIDYWTELQTLPDTIEQYEAYLIASDLDVATLWPSLYEKAVVYRPKTLVVGIGCDRGASSAMLLKGLTKILQEQHLSPQSIESLATIDKKLDEIGLQELSQQQSWPLHAYTASVLDQTEGILNPSPVAKRYVGTCSVAEAAALQASGASDLLVSKRKIKDPESGLNMTVAICRKPFAKRDASLGEFTS